MRKQQTKSFPSGKTPSGKSSKTGSLFFCTISKPLGLRDRALLDTGASHNAAGRNPSRSTNRSATGKSEKNNKHQQPEHHVAHNRCPSPCRHCEQIHPDKQAKYVPAGGRCRRRESGIAYRVSGKEKRAGIFSPLSLRLSYPIFFPIPDTLFPSPYSSIIATASISISASGFTRAFTTTPVAAGKPFWKYFLRTAAVSLYLSRVVT